MDDKTRADEDQREPDQAVAAAGSSRRTSSRPDRSGSSRRRGGFEFSPINKRRWQNFKANRRGYWSLWIFLVLFVLTLFAEFIANDKPLYVSYDGKFVFPGHLHLSGDRLSAATSRPRPIIAIPICRS